MISSIYVGKCIFHISYNFNKTLNKNLKSLYTNFYLNF